MTEERSKRKLAAILSADVKGYSRLMADDEEATVRTINAYRALMTDLIHEYQGRVVDAKGDNVLAEFPSVVDALRCAVRVQKELAGKNSELPGNRRMEFRIGINLGDVIEEEGIIYGDGVNVAARLEGLAEGGGICISGTAFEHVKNRVQVGYAYQGKQRVKNIPDPVQVYRVLLDEGSAGKVKGGGAMRKRNRWMAAAAIVLVAVIGGLVWNFYFQSDIEPASVEKMAFPLPDKPSIAVLPFKNLTAEKDQAYLADGITEDIITALSKTPQMFVIASNSVFTYKDKPVKVQQVAEDLSIRYVLEGSVQKAGDRIRINAQLIDAVKGHHLWAERYDRDFKDLFALQDEMTMKILTSLEVTLTEGEAARSHAKGTDNLEAYLKDLQGREYLQKLDKDSNMLSKRLLEQAIALDPNFASPHVGLAYTYLMDVRHGWTTSPRKAFGKAAQLAQKALKLDDSLDMAHALAGRIYGYKREYDQAVSEGEKAVALGPGNTGNLMMLAVTLTRAGKAEEAVKVAEEGIRLDPKARPLYLSILGDAYRDAGRYEDAISTYEAVLKQAPGFSNIPVSLAAAYMLAGHGEKAHAAIQGLLQKNPKLCVETVKAGFERMSFKSEEIYANVIEALRSAGLPETEPLPLPDKPSIAVLPFVNMSGDPEQEYFSDGISEEIITSLSKTPKLFVIARTSSFRYKGKEIDITALGRELGVRYVLEGSVRKSENKVRITAQLIDAQTNRHVWAERYDRDLEDIFAVQEDITKNIVTALGVQLTGGEQIRVFARGTNSLDAYLKFLEAYSRHIRMDKESNVIARRFAEEAVALDPKYGAAFKLLGAIHMLDGWLGAADPKASIKRAIESARKGVDLDGNPSAVLGYLYLLTRHHEKAIDECRRAVEVDPNSAPAHAFLGYSLKWIGRFGESVDEFEYAIRLDPFPSSFYWRGLGNSLSFLGRHEEAIDACRKAVKEVPNDLISRVLLTHAYSEAGREAEAKAEAKEVLRINPKFSLDAFAKLLPAKNPSHTDQIVTALRKAGL